MKFEDFQARLKIIGARVAYYRKLKKYNQLELAEMCDLSETYICRIENAKAKGITLEICIKLAEALGIEVEQLIKANSDI